MILPEVNVIAVESLSTPVSYEGSIRVVCNHNVPVADLFLRSGKGSEVGGNGLALAKNIGKNLLD